MNKQYLRSLQQRAQRLLQISSDEQSQQQNFNIVKARSRRVDLNEVLSNTDLNQLNTQFQNYRNTDVQLLRRCINLTSQNAELKRLTKTFETEKSQLKARNAYLERELQSLKIQMARIKERQRAPGQKQQFSRGMGQNNQYSSVNNKDTQQSKQKSQSVYKPQPKNSHATTSQQAKNRQNDIIQERCNKRVQQLQQRLKISNSKKQSFQQALLKQKQKSQKLWKFINHEIPELRDVVTGLTNKVDVKLQGVLLKDINRQENEMRLVKKNYTNGY